jgi:chromosome partitioning protein
VLPTFFDIRAAHARAVLADVSARYGVSVLEPPILRSVRFAEAPGTGRSILTTASRSKGAESYRAHARTLVGPDAPVARPLPHAAPAAQNSTAPGVRV